MKILLLFSLLVCLRCTSTNAAALSSDPPSTNGVLRLCPDVPLSITCSHGNVNGGVTRWRVTGTITQNCNEFVSHVPPMDDVCGPFTINMVSDDSGTELSSTAQLAAVPETLDGAVVECLDGGGSGAESVGIITIQVVDPTPSIDSILYSVGTQHSGSVTLAVSSPKAYDTPVTYSRSVNGETVQIDDSSITAAGLSYTESFIINVLGITSFCPGVRGSTLFNSTFNITELTFSMLSSSLTCSSQSLNIQTMWTIAPGFSETNISAVPLSPLLIFETINYTSESDASDMVATSSPYTLTNPIMNDTYTFTVSVTNIAGTTTVTSLPVRATAIDVDESTVDTTVDTCLTVNLSEDCSEDISTFNLTYEQGFGNCPTLLDFTTTTIPLTSHSTCLPVDRNSAGDFCYRVTLAHQGTPIATKTNINASTCLINNLGSFLGAGVSYTLDSSVNGGIVVHLTRASLSCSSPVLVLVGEAETRCIDGLWTSSVMRSCTLTGWLIVVIIIIMALILVIIIVVIVVVVCYKYKASISNSKPKDAEKLTRRNSSPPPPADSLYADPNTIEHQPAPGTEDQYAMVDRKGKKNTKPKPTPPEALYQDPNTIEHETAASGDTYAVVDKPKRSSKKKGGPDVVPPASEGLTYADIDLSSKRPKPGSGRQAPQQPGEYPKEHPVEYSSVDHTSQL